MKLNNIEIKIKFIVGIVGVLGSILLLLGSFFFSLPYIYPFLVFSFAMSALLLIEMYLRIQHNIDRNKNKQGELDFISRTIQQKISGASEQQVKLSKELVDLLEQILERNQVDNNNFFKKMEDLSSELNSAKTDLSAELNSAKTDLFEELKNNKHSNTDELKAYADMRFENLRAMHNKLGSIIEELLKSFSKENKF